MNNSFHFKPPQNITMADINQMKQYQESIISRMSDPVGKTKTAFKEHNLRTRLFAEFQSVTKWLKQFEK